MLNRKISALNTSFYSKPEPLLCGRWVFLLNINVTDVHMIINNHILNFRGDILLRRSDKHEIGLRISNLNLRIEFTIVMGGEGAPDVVIQTFAKLCPIVVKIRGVMDLEDCQMWHWCLFRAKHISTVPGCRQDPRRVCSPHLTHMEPSVPTARVLVLRFSSILGILRAWPSQAPLRTKTSRFSKSAFNSNKSIRAANK